MSSPITLPIRYHGNVKLFLLGNNIELLIDLVKKEFSLHSNASLSLTVPYPFENSSNLVIVPFDNEVLRNVVIVNKPKVFELRVYEDRMDVDELHGNFVRAVYDFDAASNKEISFSMGDVIEVVGRYNKDWYKGKIGQDSGFFPANYVKGLENVHVGQVEMEQNEGEGDWQDHEYFDSYANLTIHLEMLQDVHRTSTYQKAINNVKDIQDKIVLDIGCGSGILSTFCALAGAKHVYAVDASDVIHLAEKVVKENKLEHKITLLKGKIEDLKLPVDKVDMIVSEWMGTMLICESMISSVLNARKILLQPNGLMLPSTSDIFLAPLCLDEYYQKKVGFWNDVYGVTMKTLQTKAHKEFFSNPVFDRLIKPEDLLCDAVNVFHIDMHKDDAEVLHRISSKFSFKMNKSGVLHAFGTWFDSGFRASRDEPDSIVLTTSPFGEPTHWRNVTFVLENHLQVEAGDEIEGTFLIFRNKQWLRHFEVTISFKKKGMDTSITQTLPLWR